MDGNNKGTSQDASFDIKTNKENLRRHFKSSLSRIPGDDRRLYEFDLKKNLSAFFYATCPQKGVWASYMPMATEANPHIEIEDVIWAYPKTFGEEMRFFTPTQGAVFEVGALGVSEPVLDSFNEVQKSDLLGVLVPGLAFSKTGKRLGRGKAYYDRFLTNFKGVKVGLGFQMQVQDEVPAEEHDVMMDYIITNEAIIEVQNG